MRKIFIDLGVMDGRSIRHFIDKHPESRDFEIFGFECHPGNLAGLGNNLGYKLIKKAAWVHDGAVRLYTGSPAASSVCADKVSGGISKDVFIDVPCLDLAKWMRDTLSQDDYIIIKSNIEGAEYALIEHLNEQGLIPWIDEWYMCWHWDKVGMEKKEHDRIEAMIPEWFDWSDYGPRKDGKSLPL